MKVYSCLVETSRPLSQSQIEELSGMKDISLTQKTPLRVLHRRSNLARTKTIHRLRVHALGDQQYLVFVFASAGTYIKEFIHGDYERYWGIETGLCQTLAR